MLTVSSFFNHDASDQWFTTKYRKGPVHTQLQERGFTIIDRDELTTNYSGLNAPVGMVDLSYVNSLPTPTPEYSTIFLAGYAWELASKNIDGKPLSEILSEWMQKTLNGKKYLMSLMPKSYLVATSDSISFDDIFMITGEWNLDCFIGVFDESHNAMFVFNEEFGTVHVSFNPANVPTNASEVSGQFDKVLEKGFVKDCKARTGGNRDRLEEYYQSVIEPYIRA